ncbi:MAG: hypothetical protein ACI825_000791 [Planctomycetota bacterium]|jgi:hypothetical protein
MAEKSKSFSEWKKFNHFNNLPLPRRPPYRRDLYRGGKSEHHRDA